MAEVYGNRWKVVRSLGEGGQAHTFVVEDTSSTGGREYVLKRLKNLGRVGRFDQEVKAIQALKHDGIVRLVDASLEADKPYFVTEFAENGTLEDAQPSLEGQVPKCLEYMCLIAEAINHAHTKGVIHRDLKPSNIFVDKDNKPVIGDFGLALIEGSEVRHTRTREAVGPKDFIAPELESGRLEDVTAKCDVYSLGKLLYWMITGDVVHREKFREDRWNLVSRLQRPHVGLPIPQTEFLNELFDISIVENPEERATSSRFLKGIRLAQYQFEVEAEPLSTNVLRPCHFCRLGYYRLLADDDPVTIGNLGLSPVAGNKWRILCCSNCGHTLFFRTAGTPGWKDYPRT